MPTEDQATAEEQSRPPRDGLVRAMPEKVEYRESDNGDGPTLHGHFAVFNEWSEIESMREGHFMERMAPGAFKKTLQENEGIKVTFQHGHDPTLGDMTLGKVRSMSEDERGVAYEVDLFDGVPPLLMNGLRAGDYGSSFRFRVTKEEFNRDPEKSDSNPQGIPERTVKEAEVYEFGPVTYPAYTGATAGVRSLTDVYQELNEVRRDPERYLRLHETVLRMIGGEEPAEEREQEPVEEPEVTENAEVAEAEPHSQAARNQTPIYGGKTDKTPLFGMKERTGAKWQL